MQVQRSGPHRHYPLRLGEGEIECGETAVIVLEDPRPSSVPHVANEALNDKWPSFLQKL
jgi:hypothetical protein